MKSRVTFEAGAGAGVVRKRLVSDDPRWRERFDHERDVCMALERAPRPFGYARLLSWSEEPPELVFERIAGEPVATERYPAALAGGVDVSGLIGLAEAIATCDVLVAHVADPVARASRLVATGPLTDADFALALRAARDLPRAFAHGDLLASNVIAGPGGLSLVDFEFAALAPRHHDLALLWVTLGRIAGARPAIQAVVGDDAADRRRSFWLSAWLHAAHEERIHVRDGDPHGVLELIRDAVSTARAQVEGLADAG